jgi:class 3 adenylate cyclase
MDGPDDPCPAPGDSVGGLSGGVDERSVVDWLAAQGIDPDLDPASAPASEVAHARRVAALAGDAVLARDAELTAREVAARAGVPVDVAVGMFHDLGIVVASLDSPQFAPVDAVLVQRLSVAADIGIVHGEELLRVVAGAMERIAEAAVAVYVQGPEDALRRRSAPVVDTARSNMLATEMALDLGMAFGPVFRHHMRQAVARQRVVQQGVDRPEMARLAVGFVDLVGSTTAQAQLHPDELGKLVSRFEATAFDVVTSGGGRLVKFIGDAIMFASPDAAAGCRIVGDLITAFTADGTLPRGGLVHGEVLFRHGDYYGPVVNLAARLVDAAIPGEVLVDRSVVEAVDDGERRFEPAGRRMLKGFADPVAVWTLVPAG